MLRFKNNIATVTFAITCFFLSILTTGYGQISVISTSAGCNLSLSKFNYNIALFGTQGYLTKSYNECGNLISLVVPGQVGNWNDYQRLDTNLLFSFSRDYANYDFKIFKSINDGQSWNKIFDSIGGGTFFTHFAFFDNNEGVVLALGNQMTRTKNGGTSWIQGGSHYQTAVTAVEIYGDSTIAVGGLSPGAVGGVLVSSTRGTSWNTAVGCNLGQSGEPRDIKFMGVDTIIAIGSAGQKGNIFTKSFNGGKNWICNTTPLIDPYGMIFKNINEGYIVGKDFYTNTGIILKTVDFGNTWLKFDTHINQILLDIKFLSDSITLVSGTGGLLFKWNY